MRFVYSKVESVASEDQDGPDLLINLLPVPGLINSTVRIARDQIEGFFAVVGLADTNQLVGRTVRITVDDETASERIVFLRPSQATVPATSQPAPAAALAAPEAPEAVETVEPAAAVEPVEPAEAAAVEAVGPAEQVESEQALEPTLVAAAAAPDEPVEPAQVVESVEPAAATVEPALVAPPEVAPPEVAPPEVAPAAIVVEPEPEAVMPAPALEPVAATAAPPAFSRPSVPVMAGPTPPGEITIYDGVVRVAPPETDEDCGDAAAALTPDQQAVEAKARAELAAAAAAPLDRRFFLYRESYEEGLRKTIIELTPQEFDLLGGAGAYLHLDDCTVIGASDLPPGVAQGMERLLERATSRPDAGLARADLERLVVAGHVVSCAVY